ncbi:MAG: DUF3794 domain-containing protein [Oscillospiraceae bacterium]
MELVVPDVSADIGKILDVRGQLLLRSRKAETDKIYISADLVVNLIYAAEDNGGVGSVETVIPFGLELDAKGADANSRLVVSCRLCRLEARALNPRKLLLRGEIAVCTSCYAEDKFVVWDGLPEGVEPPIYLRYMELNHSLVVGVRDKSFVVSDEYRLPTSRAPGSKLLSTNTQVCVSEAKAVGNKLVLKASADTVAIFICGESGMPFSQHFSTPFSQIIELDSYGENYSSSVTLELSEAEFVPLPERDGNGALAAQFHVTATAVCTENKTSKYVEDAYSNRFEVEVGFVEITATKTVASYVQRLQLKGNLNAKASLNEITYLATVGVCAELNGEEISCRADVSGVGTGGTGELEALELALRSSFETELAENQYIVIKSLCYEPLTVIGTGRNAEISLDVNVSLDIIEERYASNVNVLEFDEAAPLRSFGKPSMVVLCSEKENDLWQIAKKYGSTAEIIEAANSIDGDFSLNQRPLLVPRATE